MTPARAALLVVCASCGSLQPYEVIAAAELAPGAEQITGPLELLGRGEAGPDESGYHMFAAYHVRLPDDRPRRIRLYYRGSGTPVGPAACDTPRGELTPVWNLGEIRRVGDEAHFFATGIEIGDRMVSIDVMTRFAFINELLPPYPFYALDLIAVVEELVPGDPDAPGPVFDPQGSGPPDWLACGAFTVPK